MRKDDSSCYYYNITTWNGFLCISGDMGCFVFSRLNDMFQFFRMDDNDFMMDKTKQLNINKGYWAEKLEAVDKNGGFEEFSFDAFRKNVDYYVEQHTDDGTWDEQQILVLKDDIYNSISEGDSPEILYQTLNEYEYFDDEIPKEYTYKYGYEEVKPRFKIVDWWEYMGSCNEYTYHYIWCCYAIVYAIKEYDKLKESNESTI
jgi:hypothetical protein